MKGENMIIKVNGRDINIQCNNPKPCAVFSDKCYTCPDIEVNNGNIINPTKLYFLMKNCKGLSHWNKTHIVKCITKNDLRNECNDNSERINMHNQEIECWNCDIR